MVRKETWILLGVFVLLLGLAYYLRANPVAGAASATPSPTPVTTLLVSWQPGEIIAIEYKSSQDGSFEVSRNEQGTWILSPDGSTSVEPGKVEQILAEITSVRVMAYLNPGYDLTAIGLSAPEKIVTVRDIQGRKAELGFGSQSPTGSGYYVQVDGQTPVVVSRYAVEAIFDLLDKEQMILVNEGPDSEITPDSGAVP